MSFDLRLKIQKNLKTQENFQDITKHRVKTISSTLVATRDQVINALIPMSLVTTCFDIYCWEVLVPGAYKATVQKALYRTVIK